MRRSRGCLPQIPSWLVFGTLAIDDIAGNVNVVSFIYQDIGSVLKGSGILTSRTASECRVSDRQPAPGWQEE